MKEMSLFRIILDNISDGVCFVDFEHHISLWNAAAEHITGYTQDEVMGRKCNEGLLQFTGVDGHLLCTGACPLANQFSEAREYVGEAFLLHKSGHSVPVILRVVPLFSGGKMVGSVEIFLQKTEKTPSSTIAEPFTDTSMKDALTALPNRIYLENYLAYKLKQAEHQGTQFCVLIADIDNFHVFNNYYGSETGDVALQSIATSLKNNIRGGDVIGRIGGEEFCGVFDIGSEKDPYTIAEKVRNLVAQSAVLYDGNYLTLTVSVGLTLLQPGDSVQSLIARADNYMYQSKRRGKNCSTIDTLPNTEPSRF